MVKGLKAKVSSLKENEKMTEMKCKKKEKEKMLDIKNGKITLIFTVPVHVYPRYFLH